ncbi:MAG: DUF2079 domain-containing protein [Myxococcota bacterium]|nr:DUF2079 domain-containing protein [Myxococcota bacterium]
MGVLSRGLRQNSVTIGVVALWLGFVLLAGAIALERYWSFSQPLGLDNAYFFQRVWQEVFLEEPTRTLLNTEVGHGIWGGRHVEPVLWMTVPFVAASPRMETLLLIQVATVGIGVFAAFGLARQCIEDHLASLLLAAAWICQPGIWDLATTDFRSLNLSVGFVALAWWGWLAGRSGWALAAGLFAMACREEVVWLVLSGMPFVVLAQPKGRRLRVGLMFLGAGLGWLGLLHLTQQTPSDFMSFRDAPHAVVGAFGGFEWSAGLEESSPGGALSQLQAATGAGFWLIPLTPFASLPIAVSWLGKAVNPGVAGPWAYHLWAVALATMALVSALGVARIGRAVQRVRGGDWGLRCTRALAGAILVIQVQNLRAQMADYWESVPGVLAGERVPSTRLGTPWEAILKLPDEVPVLTEAYFVAQQANRAVVYAVDDFQDPAQQASVLSAVEWVLLRKNHEWMPRIEAAGFVPYAEGGAARLHRRNHAPGASLNPMTPR